MKVDWVFVTYEVYADATCKKMGLRILVICGKLFHMPAFELNRNTTTKENFRHVLEGDINLPYSCYVGFRN
jgi:hypothetical protein